MKKYLKVWWILAANTFQIQTAIRWAALLFLTGKLLRFLIVLFFIIVLLTHTKTLAGYNLDQVIFFLLTYNLIDTLAQLVFREVYRFRQAIISGTFDFYLLKPINVLFRSLLGGPDMIDLITVVPLLIAIIYYIGKLGVNDLTNILFYILLVLSALIIATAFHIIVLALAIITTEIDNAIMMYRDLVGVGRMPIDIFKEPIRGFLTYLIPVGLMISFPVKSLLGLLSPLLVIYSLIFALIFFYLSLQIWEYALRKYTSVN